MCAINDRTGSLASPCRHSPSTLRISAASGWKPNTWPIQREKSPRRTCSRIESDGRCCSIVTNPWAYGPEFGSVAVAGKYKAVARLHRHVEILGRMPDVRRHSGGHRTTLNRAFVGSEIWKQCGFTCLNASTIMGIRIAPPGATTCTENLELTSAFQPDWWIAY